MRLCLFEDDAGSLEPLSWTRPVFALRCGHTSLAEKQIRVWPPDEIGVVIRPHLVDLYRHEHPQCAINDAAWLRAGPTLWVNGRWLPPMHPPPRPPFPCVGLVDDQVAFALVHPTQAPPVTLEALAECVEKWRHTLPTLDAGGDLIQHPWDLVEHNARQLEVDFAKASRKRLGKVPATLSIVGPAKHVLIDATAHIEPLVVADATGGPVMIDRDVVITAFTRLEGPCYIGPHTHVFGAKIRAGTSLGPHCRVGGEVEASILHGHSNKYHEGFLGHSYVGEWVNLAAGTHNSDLRNDYGEVTVTVAGRPIATGLNKVGCFLGDHTKTGLGTLFNTGTNVGIFCNLLPAGPLAPKYVPSFTSWWNGTLRESSEWTQLLTTADKVMQRRGCSLTDAHVAAYQHVFAETAAERERALRRVETQAWRRSA